MGINAASEEKKSGTAKGDEGGNIKEKSVENRQLRTRSGIKFTGDTSLL